MATTRQSIDSEGNTHTWRLAQDETGTHKWIDVTNPNSVPLQAPEDQPMTHASVPVPPTPPQDSRSKRMYQLANSLTPMQRFLITGERTASSLVNGLKDIGGIGLQYAFRTPPIKKAVEDYTEKRMLDRMRERSKDDDIFKEFDDTQTIPGYIGGAVPYAMIDAVAGPVFAAAAARGISTAARGIADTAEGGKSVIHQLLEKMAASKVPGVNTIGQRGVEDFVKPSLAEQFIKSQQKNRGNPFLAGRAGDVVGGTVLGGTEGLVDQKHDPVSGMVAGGMGSLLPYNKGVGIPGDPRIPLPLLNKIPVRMQT